MGVAIAQRDLQSIGDAHLKTVATVGGTVSLCEVCASTPRVEAKAHPLQPPLQPVVFSATTAFSFQCNCQEEGKLSAEKSTITEATQEKSKLAKVRW